MPRAPSSTTDRFADRLAEHVDQDDIRAGRGRALDPGGDVLKTARALGITPIHGNEIMQRLRRKYGRQAT